MSNLVHVEFLATIKWQIWLVHNCLLLNKKKIEDL